MSGRSALGCLPKPMLTKLPIAAPRMVHLLSGTAGFAPTSSRIAYIGTKRPPPPMPAPAANEPSVRIRTKVTTSRQASGASSPWWVRLWSRCEYENRNIQRRWMNCVLSSYCKQISFERRVRVVIATFITAREASCFMILSCCLEVRNKRGIR